MHLGSLHATACLAQGWFGLLNVDDAAAFVPGLSYAETLAVSFRRDPST